MAPKRDSRPRLPLRRPISPIWFGVIFFGLVVLGQLAFAALRQTQALDYSQFKTLLAQGQIVEVRLSDTMVQGKYTDGTGAHKSFSAVRVAGDANLVDQ